MGPALGSDAPALSPLCGLPRRRQDGDLRRRFPVHHPDGRTLQHPGRALEELEEKECKLDIPTPAFLLQTD